MSLLINTLWAATNKNCLSSLQQRIHCSLLKRLVPSPTPAGSFTCFIPSALRPWGPLPQETFGALLGSTSVLPLCSAQLDYELLEDMTEAMAPCVRTLHAWPWEFDTCVLDTYMNYQERKFLLVTCIMVINHCQPHFF